MKSQRSISNELHYISKQALIVISKKISNDILVIYMFICEKGITIPQTKLGYFLAF